MSFDNDIIVNFTVPEDSEQQQEALTKKQRNNEKWQKKNGVPAWKRLSGHHRKEQHSSHPNGTSKDTRLPQLVSGSHCTSTPSTSTMPEMPSVSDTVKEQPAVSVGTKAAPPVPSGASSSPSVLPSKCLALDCEMVGVGPKGSISQLARCSIVSYEGDVVYDKFIKPTMPVTDYRTRWSGIRRADLVKATPYPEARKEIIKLLMGKVVIGHAVKNDLKVIGYCHPAALTRDTSTMTILNDKAGFTGIKCVSLKKLTKAIFNRDIQTGRKGHCSVEDAKATMELYKVVEDELEGNLMCKT